MTEPRNKIARLRAAGVAVTTILAMLVAPLCGTLCATSSHCSARAGVAPSEAGACHHNASFAAADASQTGIAAAKMCNQVDLPAVTPRTTKSWSPSLETHGSTPQLQAIAANERSASSLGVSRAPWLKTSDRPRPSDPHISTTILQI